MIRRCTCLTARFVVLCHVVQDDPVFNYGNQAALDLWEMDWEQLIQTPSRLTAEPVNRQERARMLQQAKNTAIYRIIAVFGFHEPEKRFFVDQVIIWNVFVPDGMTVGQAATFSTWRYL